MPQPTPAQDKLNAIGEDAVIEWITVGQTQAEICEKAGVGVGRLNAWLHENPDRSARARDAMKVSAEAWQDRGLKAIMDAAPDAVEIARARAIEQHCARRAAIRDPRRHGDKIAVGGADDLPPIKTMGDADLLARIAALQRKVSGDPG